MKYISLDSTEPLPSPHNGFWVKDDTVYDVTFSSHVAFVLDNVNLFSISLEEIEEAYSNCGEPFGSDGGKAREQLIRRAIGFGWIRIRKYEKPNYISIQCKSTHDQRMDIVTFLKWAIESGIIKADDAAVILGFQDEGDRHSYPWEDGGIGRYIETTDLGNS
jgi:hypothetical protein